MFEVRTVFYLFYIFLSREMLIISVYPLAIMNIFIRE